MKIVHIPSEKELIMIYIYTDYNVADIMTKIMQKEDFFRLQEWILFGYNKIKLQEMVLESKATRKR